MLFTYTESTVSGIAPEEELTDRKDSEVKLRYNFCIARTEQSHPFCALQLDVFLTSLWDRGMENGIFRYSVDDVSTKVIPGRYGFVIQVNASVMAFMWVYPLSCIGGTHVVCLLVNCSTLRPAIAG